MIELDERGVAQQRQRIAWDDIRSYRLAAWPLSTTHGIAGGLIDVSAIIDFWHALRGDRTETRLRCELIGEQQQLVIDDRDAIDEVMRRIGPRLLARARDELARERVAHFGDLALGARGVSWRSREPLAFEAVEKVELVDNRPVEVFVRERDRAWPYAHFALDAIPNVIAMLELAKELGYRVVKLAY